MTEVTVELASVACAELCEKNKIRVLHVDDDAEFLAVAKQCLEEDGRFQVDAAISAEEALEKLRSSVYDVVIADYLMPGKNGLEFLREVKRGGNGIPFILFTSKGKEEIAIQALNSGVERYVDKAGNAGQVYEELKRSICAAVKNRRAEKLLVESENRLKLITENMQDVLLLTDGSLVCTHVSSSIKTVLGHEPSDVVGKSILEFVHPDNLPTVMRSVENAEGSGGIMEVRCRRSDGSYAVVEGNGRILTDENGNFTSVVVTLRDVTERKRVEQELKNSEEKYRSLFANMLNGFAYCEMIWDENGQPVDFVYLEINDAFEKLTGLKKASVLGKKVTEAIPGIKEAHPELFDIYGKVALTGKEENIEIYFKPLNIWLSISVYSPKKGYFAAVFENVTERKKAEEKLRFLKEFNERIVDSIGDALLVIDLEDFTIKSVNEAALKHLKLRREDMIGKTCYEITHNSLAPCESLHHVCPVQEMLKTGKAVTVEHVHFDRDNNETHVEVSAHPVRNKEGNIIKVLHLARDVTERTKNLEKMRFQAELLNAAGQTVIATDKDARITYWNSAAEELHGWSEAEMKGQSISRIIPEEIMQEQMSKVQSRTDVGESWSGEVTVKRRDGAVFPVMVTISPIMNDKREVVGTVSVETDISEQKWMQEVLNEAVAKVAELNEKLHVVESLTRHDVRNKLSALNGRVFLLKKRLVDNAEALPHLKDMELVSQQILRILEFERIYVQVGAEELTDINVEQSYAEAASLFSDLKDAKLINECHGLTVLADSLLRQLFYNLIDNSLKYGEKLTKIRLHYEEEESLLRLIYEDDGVGVPEEMKSRLFEKGFGKGTGYGLYLIKRTCEAYGWTIQESGKEGQGAQFTMTIPKTASEGKRSYQTGN